MSIISRLLANIIGLWLAVNLVSGFHIYGGWKGYLIAGIVLGLLNLLVKPILKLITFPLIIVTLGLFGLVINALLLWLAGQFAVNYIAIDNNLALIGATLILTTVNIVAHWL